MKKLITTTISVAILASLSLNVSALELKPTEELGEALPSIFGKVIEVEKDGEKMLDIKYSNTSTSWTPMGINSVMNAYGKSLKFDVAENMPKWYCKANEVETEEGILKKSITYSTTGYAWRPHTLHEFFKDYGLTLSVDNVAMLPSGYATVSEKIKDDKVIKEITFGTDNIMWTGAGIANVLLAYQ